MARSFIIPYLPFYLWCPYMVRSSVAAFPTFLFPECSGAMARGKIGKISNIDNGKLGNIALGKMGKSAQKQNEKKTVGSWYFWNKYDLIIKKIPNSLLNLFSAGGVASKILLL